MEKEKRLPYGFLKVSSHLPSENLLYPLRKNSDTPFSVSHCPGLPGLLSPSVQRFSRQQHFHISSSLPYPTKQQTIHLFNVKINFYPSLSGAAPPLLLVAISTSRSTYPSWGTLVQKSNRLMYKKTNDLFLVSKVKLVVSKQNKTSHPNRNIGFRKNRIEL